MRTKTIGKILSQIVDVFLALFLILNCQSVFQNSVGFNFHVYEITAILIVLSVIIKFSFSRISVYNFNRFCLFICCYFIYLVVFIFFSVNKETVFSFLGRYGLFPFVAFNFLLDVPSEDKYYIFKKFIDWVIAVTIISLFFWFFGSTLKIITPNKFFSFKWGQQISVNSYFGLYFETQYVDWIGIDFFYRNTAIFVEGPMFCLVLISAIIFLLSCPVKVKFKKSKLLILCIGLISTFSTTGLLFLGLLLLCAFYKRASLRKYLLVILPVILILGLYFIIKKSNTGSFFLRLDDYAAGFKTWVIKPLFGHGFGDFDAVIENMTRKDNTGFSNSIFAVLVQGGIIFGVLFFVPIMYGLIIGLKKKNGSLFFVTISYTFLFVLIVFQTAFVNFYFWMLIYSYPLKQISSQSCRIKPCLRKRSNIVQ